MRSLKPRNFCIQAIQEVNGYLEEQHRIVQAAMETATAVINSNSHMRSLSSPPLPVSNNTANTTTATSTSSANVLSPNRRSVSGTATPLTPQAFIQQRPVNIATAEAVQASVYDPSLRPNETNDAVPVRTEAFLAEDVVFAIQ